MEEECRENDGGKWWPEFEYIVLKPASEDVDLPSTEGGERPLGINLRPHCLTVVRKVDEHRMGGYSTRSMV